ncbi:unknow [Vibrio campbellii]|nr:unknow [Vibrio campbellii]
MTGAMSEVLTVFVDQKSQRLGWLIDPMEALFSVTHQR